MLTFIFEGGTSVSAALFRKFGSSFRQCSDEVLIARSNSKRCSKESRKLSAPVTKI